jgi:hypothetical protein
MTVRRKGKSYTLQFYVVKGAKNNLLSREASAAMDLIHLSLQEAAVYGDIGRMNVRPVQIKLVPDAIPYCTMTPRRVPLPLIARVRNELARMERAGVIRKITEPTEWCAPIVPVVKSNNSVRICVDLKRLNKSVLRERYILPTIEDILPDLKDAKVFSTLDASSGFWAIPLEEESQKLTTFITPYGRYCFRRLPFGISSAPEIFMRIMHELLQDLPGTATYMDDILVYGRTTQEHDERLKKVLATIQKSGLRLNKAKCVLRKEEIDFLGHHLTPAGVQPSPAKKIAITKLSPPKNITELRSVIGMTNYLAKFCPNLASKMKPLYDLLCSDRVWMWGPLQQKAFKQVKQLVSSSSVLAFFDVEKETIVSADASSYGLGAMISQVQEDGRRQPIAFASRTLTDAERRYAQIEKECLASVWACEKFSHYLKGLHRFTLETDHKPLVSLLMSKDIDQVPLRCQRLIIRMMRFNPVAEHVPGKQSIIPDFLSHHPTRHERDADLLCIEVESFVSLMFSLPED